MKNILKSWKSTLVGLIIVAGLTYKAFTTGFTITDSLSALIAIGFMVVKDNDQTHSTDLQSNTGGHPDPNKEEK